MPTILRLRSITRGRNRHISSKQHETHNTQQRIVPIWTQGPQQSQRPHVHGRHRGHPINNRVILNITQIIRAVMSLAAEAKLGTLFIKAKMAVSMQCMLKEMGYPQTCTPIQTSNLTAHALLSNKILPKALKAMDMQFHWLYCQKAQHQYWFYWRPGTQNLADYWTKHHPANHHKALGHES